MTINIPDPAQKIVTLSKSAGQDTIRVTVPVSIIRKEMERVGYTDMELFTEELVMQIFTLEGQDMYGFRFVKKSGVMM